MPAFAPDVIQAFSSLQNQIWEVVSSSVSEAVGKSISFASPLTVSARTSDLYPEIADPMMAIQFNFSGLAESTQAILLPPDTVLAIAELVTGEEADTVDEDVVTAVRGVMESIVQGVCLAAGQTTGDTVVASGLLIRYQVFTFPPNLQSRDELARTQITVAADGLNGRIVWLTDDDTVHYLLGRDTDLGQEDGLPFAQADASFGGGNRGSGDDGHGIDRLMDIPLEISVELGRVKMLVKDVVELGTGSIVEIEKAAGEPVDVMVNGRLVARGEVVVIEDNFGVRVTEILNPLDRLNKMNDAA